jgi:ADP-heptose:LPS heptosyltransferase
MKNDFNILLSRTDAIGDVILTLPMAGILKEKFPNCKLFFLGRTYTKAVVEVCEHIDEFINYDEVFKKNNTEQITFLKSFQINIIVHVFPVKKIAQLAKKAGIPKRVGTKNRLYHWFTCNTLLSISRKNSDLHEAQLNIQLLSFLNINTHFQLNEISSYYGFTKTKALENKWLLNTLEKTKTNIILHPKSKGSAREWGLDNFSKLISQISSDNYQFYISGTEDDGVLLKNFIKQHPKAIDLTGKLNLSEFISFIQACNVLVAASTGPLHIAAALGKKAIGLYAPMRPIHPGRWAPIGNDAHYLVFDKICNDCKKGGKCSCIEAIEVQKVISLIEK